MSLNWGHAAITVGGLALGVAISGLVRVSGNALGLRPVEPLQAPLAFDLEPGPAASDVIALSVEGMDVVNGDLSSITQVATLQTQLKAVKGSPDAEMSGPRDVMLEREFLGIDAVYEWRQDIETRGVERRDVVVTTYDSQLVPTGQYRLSDAWPRMWETPGVLAGGGADTTETITLAVSDLVYKEL